ncbi:MAG: hypothetical protein JWN94_1373 [Betaproteobacteria bacterium]|nr:hypothetical protein [Betaproteobacteria bacterium]
MKLNDHFERIRIINLAQRKDRRTEMAEQLARVGLSWDARGVERFDAVRPTDTAGFPSIGARGCFMSHLGILRASSEARNVLILEDDLNFALSIGGLMEPALKALPPGWGIFYGGGKAELGQNGSGVVTRAPAGTRIETTHFVAFNGPVIARAVSYLEAILKRPPGHPDGGPMHVDGAYSRFRADNPDIETWVAIPELGYQRPSRTDIHAQRWFDRAPVVRDAVAALRRLRARHRHSP